jgi:hypothetical protein
VYLVTMLFTELITNNAAAVLMFPIALSTSESLGVSFMPFAIAIMMAASASFSTPIGYQCNLMVYGPGGYRFSDYFRVGIPLNLLMAAVTLAICRWCGGSDIVAGSGIYQGGSLAPPRQQSPQRALQQARTACDAEEAEESGHVGHRGQHDGRGLRGVLADCRQQQWDGGAEDTGDDHGEDHGDADDPRQAGGPAPDPERGGGATAMPFKKPMDISLR